MGFGTWLNLQAKKLDWISIQLMKLSVFAFALMVAKLWKPILSLDWYWYALIFVIAAIGAAYKVFRKWNYERRFSMWSKSKITLIVLGAVIILGLLLVSCAPPPPTPTPTPTPALPDREEEMPAEIAFKPSEPVFDPTSPSFDPFAIETPCRELEDPNLVEEAYRHHIFASVDETLDGIELSGDQVLEIKNRRVVLNGDITLRGNARLVVENFYILWNNSYFAEYMGLVQDNAAFEAKHSVLVKGCPGNLNVYVEGQLTMDESISFFDIIPCRGSVATINSSQLVGPLGVNWPGDGPSSLKVTNSRVSQIVIAFSSGEPEEVLFSGLRWGGPQSLSVSTMEGASLKVENSWIGRIDKLSRGGWVFDINEVPYVKDHWEFGTPVPDDAELGVLLNKKHYIIVDSEVDSMWLWFTIGSKVRIANWKAGRFTHWNLHQDFEVQGVGYDVTLENTSVNWVKWMICGETEVENNDNCQISPYGRDVRVTVTNSVIPHNLAMRGNENVKLINCTVPSEIAFLDARRMYAAGGHIHYLEFENTTISGTMEVASTYTRISGTVTILMEEQDVNYDWGTVEREYPLEVKDENGNPVSNAEVKLFDFENNLVWNGTTDQNGSAQFTIRFTEDNWNEKWRLEVTTKIKKISREIGFLTSTPVILSL